MSQVLNIKNKLHNVKLIIRLKAELKYDKKADLFFGILTGDINQN